MLQYTTHSKNTQICFMSGRRQRKAEKRSAFTFHFYYKGLGCKDPWKYMIQIQTGCPGAPRSELCTHWDTCAHSGHTLGQTGPHSYRANLQEQHTEQDWVHTHFPRHKIHKVSLRCLCLQPFPPTCHLAMLEHTGTYNEQEGKFVSCLFAHSTQLSPFFP